MKKIKLLTICLAISMMFPLAACDAKCSELDETKAQTDVNIVLNDIATKNAPVYNALTEDDLEEQVAYYDAQYEELRASWNQSDFKVASKDVYYNAINAAKMAEEEAGGTSSNCLGVKVKSKKSGYTASAELVYPTRNVVLYITYDNNLVITDISFTPTYTFGEVLKKASLNTLLGMGTVFCVLILIMGIIYLFGLIPVIQKKAADKKAKKAMKAAGNTESVDKTIAQIVEKEEDELADDYELVAVISAAIAAYEGNAGTDGFVVRSIKKSNSKKWQNAQY